MTRYELLDRIGVGGMAEIFRGKAVAAGGFEKPVAIKRILPHLSQDSRFVELLIAEAKVLSLLKHRNIVQIFDVGLGDDGQYFLVMEYVDGKDVGAVQRALEHQRRRLSFGLALHIGAEICEALEHAHTARGPDGKPMALVHRDVSPSNVLLSRAGEVKLTDFGIAKRAEHDATHRGAVRGKFAYISPEQARNEPLDPRSDVFSVGILLWELICNQRLFSMLDDLAALRAVREAEVARPTQVDNRLPPDIDPILMTALARDKQRRYASCGQLGSKLRALRYALDVTVGDPAGELARVIESTEEVERQSQPMLAQRASGRFDFDGAEPTVIRIHTADAFSAHDKDQISHARLVIDRFEEEETRQAQLTGDQLRLLRGLDEDSVDMTIEKPRLDTTRRPSAEQTVAREPLDLDGEFSPGIDTPPESTHRRTQRDPRSSVPGTRHERPGSERGSTSRSPASRSQGLPSTSPPPVPSATRVPRRPTPGPPISSPTSMPGPPAPSTHMPGMQPPGMQPPGMYPPGAQPPGMQPPGTYPPGAQPPANSSGPIQPPIEDAFPATPVPPDPASGYPGWGPPIAAQRPLNPSTRDSFDQPGFPNRAPAPKVASVQRERKPPQKPWVLIVGALLMAALAFAITRAFLG